MLLTIVSILLIIASALLILVVLVQPGKGDMISGMSGIGTQFNSVLGTKRATDMLTKITWTLAFSIMGVILLSNLFLVDKATVSSGDQQVLPTEGMQVPLSQPTATPNVEAPASAPAQTEQPAQEAPATETETEPAN